MNDRSKFKKVEMLVFNGEDPNLWLFHTDQYFQIHKLTDSKKMKVATISFDGLALDCIDLKKSTRDLLIGRI